MDVLVVDGNNDDGEQRMMMTTMMGMFLSLMATMMMTNEDERWENLVRIVLIPLLFLLLLEAKSGDEPVFRTQRRPEVVIAGMKWDCP